jgi:hypothetical protein
MSGYSTITSSHNVPLNLEEPSLFPPKSISWGHLHTFMVPAQSTFSRLWFNTYWECSIIDPTRSGHCFIDKSHNNSQHTFAFPELGHLFPASKLIASLNYHIQNINIAWYSTNHTMIFRCVINGLVQYYNVVLPPPPPRLWDLRKAPSVASDSPSGCLQTPQTQALLQTNQITDIAQAPEHSYFFLRLSRWFHPQLILRTADPKEAKGTSGLQQGNNHVNHNYHQLSPFFILDYTVLSTLPGVHLN